MFKADSLNVAQDLPTCCPACQSTAIATAAKKPDNSSYWRCTSCGELWNASRSRVGRYREQQAWR